MLETEEGTGHNQCSDRDGEDLPDPDFPVPGVRGNAEADAWAKAKSMQDQRLRLSSAASPHAALYQFVAQSIAGSRYIAGSLHQEHEPLCLPLNR